jgi:purine-nucleoside phosphorylase
MLDLYDKTQDACAVIQKKWGKKPHAGIILGTGLGPLVNKIHVQAEFDYSEIPHFLKSTATSHRGRLLCGELSGVPVVAMEGRFHMYEGYPLDLITLPVRVMKFLGAQLLMVSNACGGMNPNYQAGDIMLIDDHINLMGGNPLIGINDDRLGPRFPDMSQPYDRRLIREAMRIARKADIIAHQGVFVAVAGPNLETRAEYRFLRQIGADVIVAVHSSMRTVGFSVVTDMCLPDALEAADVSKIIAIANDAEPRLTTLLTGVLEYDAARGS